MAVPNKRKEFETLASDSKQRFCDVSVARRKNNRLFRQ
jgi:hypothetical protein